MFHSYYWNAETQKYQLTKLQIFTQFCHFCSVLNNWFKNWPNSADISVAILLMTASRCTGFLWQKIKRNTLLFSFQELIWMIESEFAVIFFKRIFNLHYCDRKKFKTNKSACLSLPVLWIEGLKVTNETILINRLQIQSELQ